MYKQMGPISIDQPRLSDVPEILDVHRAASILAYENPARGATPEALQRLYGPDFTERKGPSWERAVRRGTGIYVARLACGRVVGIGEGLDGETHAEITALYVHPDYQRKPETQGPKLLRVGTRLLQALLLELRHPIVRLDVTKGIAAVGFYASQKFRQTERPAYLPKPPLQYGIKLPQLQMELRRND